MRQIVIITTKDTSGLYIETAFESLEEAAAFAQHEERHGRKVVSRSRIMAFASASEAIEEAAKWRK